MTNLLIDRDHLSTMLKVVVDEVTDALAADCMLRGFSGNERHFSGEGEGDRRAWAYIEQALLWKLGLAVSRLLQPAGKDRNSLAGLVAAVNTAGGLGLTPSSRKIFDDAVIKLNNLRELNEAKALKADRDSFMAHIVRGSSRTGMDSSPVRDLCSDLSDIVDNFHLAILGTRSTLNERWFDWGNWSNEWWGHRYPSK